jgi:hypothetical protein
LFETGQGERMRSVRCGSRYWELKELLTVADESLVRFCPRGSPAEAVAGAASPVGAAAAGVLELSVGRALLDMMSWSEEAERGAGEAMW